MEKPHKKLNVWKSSIDLVSEVYTITHALPAEERYGLASQMKRASISVASNIAEGAARNTKKEFINYLHMAQGSLSELDTHLEIAKRLRYVSEEKALTADTMMNKIDKMLSGLIRHQRSPDS